MELRHNRVKTFYKSNLSSLVQFHKILARQDMKCQKHRMKSDKQVKSQRFSDNNFSKF